MTQRAFDFTRRTSQAGARHIAPKAGSLRARVLDFLRCCEGATDDEIADAFPEHDKATVRARRVELVQAGLVRASGATRPGRSGCAMVVWTAAKGDI